MSRHGKTCGIACLPIDELREWVDRQEQHERMERLRQERMLDEKAETKVVQEPPLAYGIDAGTDCDGLLEYSLEYGEQERARVAGSACNLHPARLCRARLRSAVGRRGSCAVRAEQQDEESRLAFIKSVRNLIMDRIGQGEKVDITVLHACMQPMSCNGRSMCKEAFVDGRHDVARARLRCVGGLERPYQCRHQL